MLIFKLSQGHVERVSNFGFKENLLTTIVFLSAGLLGIFFNCTRVSDTKTKQTGEIGNLGYV